MRDRVKRRASKWAFVTAINGGCELELAVPVSMPDGTRPTIFSLPKVIPTFLKISRSLARSIAVVSVVGHYSTSSLHEKKKKKPMHL